MIAGGIDKGEGLRFLLNHLGISPEEVLAMGDGGSDIPLLQAAGIGRGHGECHGGGEGGSPIS